MVKRNGLYPRVHVDTADVPAVGQAGGVLLTEAAAVTGLGAELSRALAPWRKPLAVHDPAKVVLDLAIALALGGDCLADVALLRAEPGVYGPVASDATVSRTVAALAADADTVLAAISAARAAARARAWALAGTHAPDHGATAKTPLIIDVDATLVTGHSDKEQAAPTFKRGFGFHPLEAFVDHGPGGTGEPLFDLLRKGNAGSNTAEDHITVVRGALKQLPGHRPGRRAGRKVLVRIDGAGSTHELLGWLERQRLSYSVGFTLPADTPELLTKIPERAWTAALDANDEERDGAWVVEQPEGMRVIARKERPHPGAQLRITDIDGHRVTAFATNTRVGQLADLELRHRRRARCEDRIRNAKDTGLANLPLFGFDQNRIWTAIVALAGELTAWLQLLGLHGHDARRWEPKRLRLRLYTIPAPLARHSRQALLHLAETAPWASLATTGITRLRQLAAPG